MSAPEKAARSAVSPVSNPEFASRLVAFEPSRTLAVAFSGGPDSLALLLLAARWAKRRRGAKLVALTVDHGLRTGSASEAREAGRLARSLDVPHRILEWKGAKPPTGIQAAARGARYRLLVAGCREAGASDLLVAHHLEDQAETFLMRLARGSGVDGLAAMPSARMLAEDEPAVRLLRPLLDLPRARLHATVMRAGLKPITDPSNENERFDRVRVRKVLDLLVPLGLDAPRLARTAGHMARARSALEEETARLLHAHAALSRYGHIEMGATALTSAPAEIGLRALAAIIRIVGGGEYGPRMEALEGLHGVICGGEPVRGRTLNGVKLAIQGAYLSATRELAAAQKATPLILKTGGEGLWDGRFKVRLVRARRGSRLDVRALGADGLGALKAAGIVLPAAPRSAFLALPGLWHGDRLVSSPHLGTLEPYAEAEATFRREALTTLGNSLPEA